MKRTIFILLVLLFVWAPGAAFVYVYGEIPDHEYEALKALYDATGGSNWYKDDNWFTGDAPVNTWHGIKCDRENKHVLEIRLSGNNLKGKLPSQLGAIKNLKVLIFRKNRLTHIPPELANLTHLEILDVGDNWLKGNIPSWIGNLKSLKELYLDLNEFTGPIPASLGNLSNLLHLNLYRNRLSGNIPEEMENLSNLVTLNLGYNQVTGMIPTRIDRLSNLKELNLSNNKMEGPIPGNLGNLPNLTILKIEKNQLEGQIPQNLAYLTQLEDNKSNFKWNALYAKEADLKNFLNRKQEGGDWESTQTIAPKVIRATPQSQTEIIIKWKSVAYTVDRGGYQVLYSTSKDGPYKVITTVNGKAETGAMIGGLQSRTTYYFIVQSWTNPHDNNQETVYSGDSNKVFATTHGTTIFGSVETEADKPLEGVTMTAFKEDRKITEEDTTAEDGKYNLSVDRGWTGKVKPSKKGFAFRPPQKEYTSPVREDRGDENYIAWITTIIKGKVTNPKKDKVIPGVTFVFSDMKESDSKPPKTETDEHGEYEFPVNYGWTGTVTPQKKGYEFFPGNIPYTKPVEVGIENQDFVAYKMPKISGSITNRRGKKVIDKVKLIFTGKKQSSSWSSENVLEENGKFEEIVDIKWPHIWAGTVKPVKKGYIFYPSKRQCDETTADGKIEFRYKAELDRKFFIAVTGNQMLPSEGSFDDVYGKSLFSPEIKAGYKFYRDFYVWGGYSFLSKNGKSYPEFKEPAKWEEKFLSLGLGYFGNFSITFGWKAEVGLIYVSFTEKMSQIEEGEVVDTFSESGNALGLRIGGASIFKFSDRLFTEISLGYLFASDKVNEISIKLGGLRAGIGLGVRF